MQEKTSLTRTIETESDYKKRSKALTMSLNAFFKSFNDKSNHSQEDILTMWLANEANGKTKSTFRHNKATLVNFFETKDAKDISDFLKNLTLDDLGEISPPDEKKTSSKKQKKISTKDKRKLDAYFLEKISSKKNNTLQIRTYVMYHATLLTGLRPIEWKDAEILHNFITQDGTIESIVLKVKNAKNTNERANGDYRHIVLSDISNNELIFITSNISSIKIHLDNSQEEDIDENYKKYYKSCGDQLREANKILWPRRTKTIPLYTFRHQFSANCKYAGFTQQEIAALMGHASDDTATIHYGRKTAGRKGLGLVRPLPEEVATVRRVSKPSPHAKTSGPKLG